MRRRKTPPGPLAGLTRALKYRMTEWAPGPLSRALSRRRCRRAARAARAWRTPSSGSSIITRRTRPRRRGRRGFASCAVLTIDGLGDGLSATISSVPRRPAGARRRVAGARLARRLLRARHQPAQHARARGRGQGDGARRLRRADCRRRQPAAAVGARAGRRHRDAVAGPRAARGRWRASTGASPTSSSPTWRSGRSNTRRWRWRATRCG